LTHETEQSELARACNRSQSGGCCEASGGSSPYGSILIAGIVLGFGLRRRRR